MVEHLAENITDSLQRSKVKAVHGWSDSMVVLHWLKRNGTYKQFVQDQYKVTEEKEKWPKKNVIEPSKESEEEANILKKVFYKGKLDECQADIFINKFEFWKTIRILSWINRSSHNIKSKEKQAGPLKTDEINKF